jgi:hypothetical protein
MTFRHCVMPGLTAEAAWPFCSHGSAYACRTIEWWVAVFYLNGSTLSLKIHGNFEVICLVPSGYQPTSVNASRFTYIHGSTVHYKSPTMNYTQIKASAHVEYNSYTTGLVARVPTDACNCGPMISLSHTLNHGSQCSTRT